MTLERQSDANFETPVQPTVVRSTDIHSVEYHMYLTTRLYRAAGMAQVCDQMFYHYLEGRDGEVEIVMNDFLSRAKIKVRMRLGPRYVYQMKKLAFNAYLALWDIKPEGPNIANEVMDNLNEVDRSEVRIVDKIDEVPSTGMH